MDNKLKEKIKNHKVISVKIEKLLIEFCTYILFFKTLRKLANVENFFKVKYNSQDTESNCEI